MSLRFEDDKIELEGLKKLTAALTIKNPPHIQVGVLKTGARNGKGKQPDNATIGAAHEYGAPAIGLPRRSWLRMPLRQHFQEKMEASRLITEKQLEEVIRTGTIRPWLEKCKLLAKAVVLEAFDTQGWGSWKKWSARYAKRKKKGTANMILQDTQQLRDSVDAEIVDE